MQLHTPSLPGFRLPSNASIEPTSNVYESFESCGALWGLETVPVAAMAPTFSHDGMIDVPVNVPGTVAHLRGDTRQPVGITSEHYTPFDNLRVAELVSRMIEASPDPVEVDSVITYSGGSGLLVGLAGGRYDIGGDPMQHRWYLHTRHDGRGGLSVFPMQTRLLCMNQLAFGLASGVTLRHASDIVRQADELVRLMTSTGQLALNFRDLGEQMTRSMSGFMHTQVIRAYLDRVHPIPARKPGESVESLDRRMGSWRTRTDRHHSEIEERLLFSEALGDLPMSRWRVLNAITEHEEHRRGKGDHNAARALPSSPQNRRKLEALQVCLEGI